MAKKPRTPPPPRRVQAPRVRHEPDPERRKTIIYASIGGGLLLLLIVLVAFVFRPGSRSSADFADPGRVLREAGCTLRSPEGLGQNHVDSLDAEVDYNSFPPSSGPHFFQPAPWGFYDDPLSQVQVVHNLEHGGAVIQYGPQTPASTRSEIEQFYRDDPRGLIVAPLPALKDGIALTAWTVAESDAEEDVTSRGRVATCPRFNEEAFRAFLDAYRFKGLESCLDAAQQQCFRPEDLEPGE